jgi:hypothetical protein
MLLATQRESLCLFLLLTAACAARQPPLQNPRLTVFFPPDVSADKIAVTAYLYGPFGAYGVSGELKSQSQSIQIPLSVKGQPASEVRLFAWIPGCQIQTFEISLQDIDVQRTYSCIPLANVTLIGQVKDTGLLRRQAAEIRVAYLADWACNFFGLSDCEVPEILLGIAKPDERGHFEIRLPGFAADPIASDLRSGSGFQLVLRNAKNWNPIAFLEPDSRPQRTTAGLLSTSASYPQPTVFAARKN